jgi:hypothetical protein
MKSTSKKKDTEAMKIYKVQVWYDWDAAPLPTAEVTDVAHLDMSPEDYTDEIEANPKDRILSEIGELYSCEWDELTMYVQAPVAKDLAEDVKEWLFEAHRSVLEHYKNDIKVVFTGVI